MYEIPGQQGLGKGEVGVNPGGGQPGAVEVDAALQVAPLGQVPAAGNRIMTDLDRAEQVAVQVIEALSESAAGAG